MPKKELPRFVIYQPNEKEYHICLEINSKFLRWSSYYAPTLDVRFPRQITRIEDIAAKSLPKKHVFDEGTYTITKSDTKESAEEKMAKGVKEKSFSFTLNGKKLKGRFSVKQVPGGIVLQKYKDKYATEEDVLSGDLSRTISTMIPDYDEKKVKLHEPAKAKAKARKTKEPEEEPGEEPEAPEITSEKRIGNTDYHFAFYTADDEPDICLITGAKSEVLVLKQQGSRWVLLSPVTRAVLKKEKEFAEHAKALYELQK